MRRNATLDYARLVAAFGIVVFHVGAPGAALGYAALPFFLILLTVMLPGMARHTPASDFLRSRAARLLLPWLVWSALYGTLKLLEAAFTPTTLGSEFAPYMLLTGPALHLWFLPFAFVVSLLALPLVRLARHVPPYALPAVLILLAVGVLVLGDGRVFPIPVRQWLYALPSICLGLALAFSGLHFGRSVLVLGAFAATAFLAGISSGLAQILIAGVAFVLCTAWVLPPSRFSDLAGQSALGVYLAHPLVLSVLKRIMPLDPEGWAIATAACLGSFGIAVLIIKAGAGRHLSLTTLLAKLTKKTAS